MQWSPKRQMLRPFFQDFEPGPFPLRRLRELHEHSRSGEIDVCRNCPEHLP